MRKLLELTLLVALSASATATALPPKPTQTHDLTVLISDRPKRADGVSDDAWRQELAQVDLEVARRLNRRLQVAGARDVNAKPSKIGVIRVSARTAHDRGWAEAILSGKGELEIRQVLDQGPLWDELASELPVTAKLESDDPDHTYLWSEDRDELITISQRIAMPGRTFHVVPRGGGWRLLWLGEVILSNKHIAKTSREQSNTGVSFAQVALNSQGDRAWSNVERGAQFAVIVDQEAVATVRSPVVTGAPASLAITCNGSWVAKSQQATCVDIVASRLAAPVPLTLTLYNKAVTKAEPEKTP